jgi:NIMA (never in mitosis gene a)-related kinase
MTALSPPFTAKDMKGLFAKVIKGVYPRIPQIYTNDL